MPARSRMLSVVIPCRDDTRVVTCVASIDTEVDLVLAFNGSPAGFADQILCEIAQNSTTRVHALELGQANLSAALEAGIAAAPSARVLLMDSDCTFRPGAIAAIT